MSQQLPMNIVASGAAGAGPHRRCCSLPASLPSCRAALLRLAELTLQRLKLFQSHHLQQAAGMQGQWVLASNLPGA